MDERTPTDGTRTGEQVPDDRRTDERRSDDGAGDLATSRRTAMKGGAAGLTALGLGSFATCVAAHHKDGHGDDDDGASSGGGGSANQFRFAGENWTIYSAASDPGENTSPVRTLMSIDDLKLSNSWQDSLVFQPSLETSLLTDVTVSGNEDRSRAVAGVLGWVEIRGDSTGGDWQMVTVDDDLVDPPTESEITAEGDLDAGTARIADLARGVVSLTSRDLELEWDLQELVEGALDDVVAVLDAIEDYYPDYADYRAEIGDHGSYGSHEDWLVETGGVERTAAERYSERATEVVGDWAAYVDLVRNVAESYDDLRAELLELDIFLSQYLETKSANSFNWVKSGVGGTHDVRMRGVLHVFVDDDDPEDVHAEAIVGNRTMLADPVKIKARASSRDEE